MKLEKNKKGSHVGMVLSFTLFITFLIFIYQIIMPSVKTFDENYEILESFKKRVVENISDEVYVIRAYDSVGTGAFVSHPGMTFANVVGFDFEGNEIETEIDGERTIFESAGGLCTFYYHEDFVKTVSTAPTDGANVPLGSFLVEERILETKIIELINLLQIDSSIVKESLDLVGEYQFDIQFKYENETWIESGLYRDYKTETYSKHFNVNYLNVNAKEEVGEIVLKIW